MREKEWVDCPVCGSDGTMAFKENIVKMIKPKGYDAVEVGPLSGYFCKKCGDGFYTRESMRKIDQQIAEGIAKQQSSKVTVDKLGDITLISKKLNVSRQRVHKMMDEGKIPYVYVRETKWPIEQPESFYELLLTKLRKKNKSHLHKKAHACGY